VAKTRPDRDSERLYECRANFGTFPPPSPSPLLSTRGSMPAGICFAMRAGVLRATLNMSAIRVPTRISAWPRAPGGRAWQRAPLPLEDPTAGSWSDRPGRAGPACGPGWGTFSTGKLTGISTGTSTCGAGAVGEESARGAAPADARAGEGGRGTPRLQLANSE
jgi:hypothetical protein